MGQIQGAINTAIQTAGTAVAVQKGIKKLETEKEIESAETKIKQAGAMEHLTQIESEMPKEKARLKEGKEGLKLAKEGITITEEGLKVPISRLYGEEEAGKYQNELIKKYQQANKESRNIIKAMKLQKAGWQQYLDFYKGKETK